MKNFSRLWARNNGVCVGVLEILTTIVGFFNSLSFASVSHFDFKSLENVRGCFELLTNFLGSFNITSRHVEASKIKAFRGVFPEVHESMYEELYPLK